MIGRGGRGVGGQIRPGEQMSQHRQGRPAFSRVSKASHTASPLHASTTQIEFLYLVKQASEVSELY